MQEERSQGAPVSNNVHNLVQTLSTKLDSVVRYRLYIEDAQREQEPECVQLFRRLEEQDRRAVEELRQHLSTRLGSSSRQTRAAWRRAKQEIQLPAARGPRLCCRSPSAVLQ